MAQETLTNEPEEPVQDNGGDRGPEEKPGYFQRLRASGQLKYILGAAAIILLGIGVLAWIYFSGRESTDDAQIDAHINPISARVSGTIIRVNVEETQFVPAGTVLFQIDPRDYEVALQRAEANLADAEAAANAARTRVPVTSTTSQSQTSSARAALEQSEAGATLAAREIEAAHTRVVSARAQAFQADANYTKAMQDLERMKILVSKDEISRQQYDAAVAAADSARGQRDAAHSAISEAEKGVEAAQARQAQARGGIARAKAELEATATAPQQVTISRAEAAAAAARVQQATAALNQARLNIQYTTVVTPVSGLVGRRNVEVGQVVQPGQPLVAVVPMEDIWVTANFKETQLKNMVVGQRAIISVDAYGGREYNGHVDSISAATGARFSLLPPENATGNYVKVVQRVPVKILFEKGQDPQHLLRPGMSVYVTVRTR